MRPWYYNVWDEHWRLVATYRGSDSDPKEQYVLHQAGFDGQGESSYINDVIVRDCDANTDWDAASDGTLEERLFYLTNWRHDVVALLDSSGHQVEHVRYSAYGVPFGLPAGDADSDGDTDAGDIAQIDNWIAAPAYDGRADVDLDGDLDATDKALGGATVGAAGGWGIAGSRSNRMQYGCYTSLFSVRRILPVRTRVLDVEGGSWLARDPAGHADSLNLYEYSQSGPVVGVDPHGLMTLSAGGGLGAVAKGALGWICADAGTPDPTDAALWKWAGYAVVGLAAGTVLLCMNEDDSATAPESPLSKNPGASTGGAKKRKVKGYPRDGWPPGMKFKCSAKARGSCPPGCKIFVGFGKTCPEACAVALAACQAKCQRKKGHTWFIDGEPWTSTGFCQCGHSKHCKSK